MKIIKNDPPSNGDVSDFLSKLNFSLSKGYLDFLQSTNGAEIYSGEVYCMLWTLTDLYILNKEYAVETFIPEFFLIGSNGGDTAYAIEKDSGKIFEIPFIGMSKDEANYKFEDFNEFIKSLL